MSEWLGLRAFGGERPAFWQGVVVAAVAVTVATVAIYPLKQIAPVVSLSVVYLPAVLLVSAFGGLGLGLLTSAVSAMAFNFFHLPPVGHFSIAHAHDWVALAAFTVAAATVSAMAEVARSRAREADSRRAEADLAAGLAQELLAGGRTEAALGGTARRVARALHMSSARIELGAAHPGGRQVAIALRGRDGEQTATLLVPRGLPGETMERLTDRVVPSLAALVAIALDRDALQAEAVETAALRRSDDLKTALLRAVSHELRSPLTAMVTAGHALGSRSLSGEERAQLSAGVVEEGERLSALIDKLLDLSRLQAGRAEPRQDWVSIEEVLLAAREAMPAGPGTVRLSMDPDLPPVMADVAQLERVFANLLENALRYSGGRPVSVHARRTGDRVVIRVVDQGPGIGAGEQERIFEPFYRGREPAAGPWTGSGLGLAIAKGFVEANHGTLSVESLPGQGSSFIVSLPWSDADRVMV
ncbi:MAG TPA: ATP-binding protein [Solirubrobacteraceae bacterium]|jgi:two-component system, OmpR family, sensor histidine kinase KdpD